MLGEVSDHLWPANSRDKFLKMVPVLHSFFSPTVPRCMKSGCGPKWMTQETFGCLYCPLGFLEPHMDWLHPVPESIALRLPLHFLCRPSSGLWAVPFISFLQGTENPGHRVNVGDFCFLLLIPGSGFLSLYCKSHVASFLPFPSLFRFPPFNSPSTFHSP